MKNASASAVALALLALPLVLSAGQVEVSKLLVGEWKGNIEGRWGAGQWARPRPRTLVIHSVREEKGRWIVEARWGLPGRRLYPVDVTLEVDGSDVSLRFPTPKGGGKVDLDLRKERYLVGEQVQPMAGFSYQTWHFIVRLEKVE